LAVITASREAPGGVGQQAHPRAVEHLDDGAARRGVDAAQRDGDDLRPAGLDGGRHGVQ
jgi:hypothetical protein